MAYSVNWNTKVVTVPQSDMALVSAVPLVYTLDVVAFWRAIHEIQEDEGMTYVDIMRSNAPVTLSGTTYVRSVEVINGYLIEFEDGQYQVNLAGANNNIPDVKVQNNVSVSNSNSAGSTTLTPGQEAKLDRVHDLMDIEGSYDLRDVLRIMLAVLSGKASGAASTQIAFRDLADTKDRVVATVDTDGNRSARTLDPTD